MNELLIGKLLILAHTLLQLMVFQKWIQQKTVFENNSLHEVLETLSIIHKIEIIFENNVIGDQCRINTSFTNENIEQILRELEILAGLKYTIINNKILIKTYKC